MYKALSPGALGMSVGGLARAIEAAVKAGFEGVEFYPGEVADDVERLGAEQVRAMFTNAGLRPAGWGLPTDWRNDQSEWRIGLQELPRLAKAAAAIGCDRTMTWIMPCSNDLPFDENRRFHIERLKPVAAILAEHGCRLGLEFIGPNVGLLLDSFHWHTSGGTTDDLRELSPEQVVYVHVNDAPPAPIDDQIDGNRALPGATGVIDIKGFLMTLEQIGYDGPVTPEPFGNPATWAKQSLDSIWKVAAL